MEMLICSGIHELMTREWHMTTLALDGERRAPDESGRTLYFWSSTRVAITGGWRIINMWSRVGGIRNVEFNKIL